VLRAEDELLYVPAVSPRVLTRDQMVTAPLPETRASIITPHTPAHAPRRGVAAPTNLHPMSIRLFITGGTFDKEYNEIDGKLFFKDTHLPEMLALGRSKVPVSIRTLMMIDSLDMTDADRALIAEQCTRAKEDKIIVTHGTDTMELTARHLGELRVAKTIVLTGAMIPYKFGSSDGLFNLGSALAFVQTLPHGVYIVMNGRYFRWDNVRKNRKTGEFEEIKK
jgi:L-asparaginase